MLRILYIDDTQSYLEFFGKGLMDAGFQVKTLPGANCDLVQEVTNFSPDLILLDIMMPEVDGFEALKILRDNPSTCTTPVFFFSNISNSATIKKGLEMGAEKYLVKSKYSPAELAKVCLEYLKKVKN